MVLNLGGGILFEFDEPGHYFGWGGALYTFVFNLHNSVPMVEFSILPMNYLSNYMENASIIMRTVVKVTQNWRNWSLLKLSKSEHDFLEQNWHFHS